MTEFWDFCIKSGKCWGIPFVVASSYYITNCNVFVKRLISRAELVSRAKLVEGPVGLRPSWCRPQLVLVGISYPHNLVNLHLETYVIPRYEKLRPRALFHLLYLRLLSKLWECMIPKLKIRQLLPITAPCLHKKSSAMPLLKALIKGFISYFYTDEL